MIAPSMSMLWGLAVVFNMGIPPSAGLVSELLIISASSKTLLYSVMFGLYLFLSAFHSVYLYTSLNHGTSCQISFSMEVKDTFVSVSHLIPLASLSLASQLLL